MKISLIILLVALQGCASFTKRNYIEISGEKKIDEAANNSNMRVGELVIEKDDYILRVINRNSNEVFLSIGPLLPIIPFDLFSEIASNGRLLIEFIVIPRDIRAPVPKLDFSFIAFESVPGINNPCGQYSIKEIIKYNGNQLEFFDRTMTRSTGPIARLYQIDCRLPGNSTPDGKGPFLTIKGIRAMNSKETFTLPDLVVTYKKSFDYEIFFPQ